MERKYAFSPKLFFSVSIDLIVADQPRRFPLYVYFKINDHLILRYHPDSEIEQERLDHYRESGLAAFWIPNEFKAQWKEYYAKLPPSIREEAERKAASGETSEPGIDPAKDGAVAAAAAAAGAGGTTGDGETSADPANGAPAASGAEDPEDAARAKAAEEQAAAAGGKKRADQDTSGEAENTDSPSDADGEGDGESASGKKKKKRRWELEGKEGASGEDDSTPEDESSDESDENEENSDGSDGDTDGEENGRVGRKKKKGEGDGSEEEDQSEEGGTKKGRRSKRQEGEDGQDSADARGGGEDENAPDDFETEPRSVEGATANDALDSPDLTDDQKREAVASLSREILDELKRVESAEPELVEPALRRCQEFVDDIVEKSVFPHPLRAVYREARAVADPLGHHATTQSLAVLFAMLAGFIERQLLADLAIAAWLHDAGYSRLDPRLFGQPRSALPPPALRELEKHLAAVAELASRDGIALSPLIQEILAKHHENADGSGYPSRLRGPAIHELAQCLSMADAVEDPLRGRADGTPVSPAEAFRLLQRDRRRWSAELFQTIFTSHPSESQEGMKKGA